MAWPKINKIGNVKKKKKVKRKNSLTSKCSLDEEQNKDKFIEGMAYVTLYLSELLYVASVL